MVSDKELKQIEEINELGTHIELINGAVSQYDEHIQYLGALLPILDAGYKYAVGFALDTLIAQRDDLVKNRVKYKKKLDKIPKPKLPC